MATPTIAVVICVYNKQGYVARSIGSVLAQTRPIDEIIVVDDGSTDNSIKEIEAFRDPRIRVLRQPHNRGAAAARNLAIRSATSEWIAFLDADDGWLEDYVEVTAQLISQAPPEIGCVFTGWEDRWPDGSVTADPFSRRTTTPVLRLDFDAFLKSWLALGATPMCASAVAFRREVLIRAGLFPEGWHRGEDKDMWLRAMALCDALSSPRVCSYYDRAVPGQAHVRVQFNVRHGLCSTLEEMIRRSTGERQLLLKRLFNAEIFRYARHLGMRERLPPETYRGYFVSLNPLHFAVLLALSHLPRPVQMLAREGIVRGILPRRRRVPPA